MDVVDATNLFKEIREIVGLGETRELRRVVEAYIDDLRHARFLDRSKKREALVFVKPMVVVSIVCKAAYLVADQLRGGTLVSVYATRDARSR
jgi:hypothetical protein